MAFTLIPAEGSDFINRKELLSEMVSTLSNSKLHMGFALYGVRRVGKTSILKETSRQLSKHKMIVPIYFSLWSLVENTVEEFAKKLTITIIDAYSGQIGFTHKAKNLFEASLALLKELLQSLSISLKLREEIEIILTMHPSEKDDAGLIIERVFSLAEAFAQETKTRCILLLDEFPSLMELKKDNNQIGEGAIKLIRTLHETQKHTLLCISGSIKKTMEITAFHPGSAFYKQFINRKIEPLEKQHIKELLIWNLKKEVPEAVIEKVWNFTRGIPFYAQAIGRQLEGMNKINVEIVNRAIKSFLTQEGAIFFQEQFSQLSSKERKILDAMAKFDLISTSEIAMQINESSTTVNRFLLYLEEKGVLDKVDKGKFQFQDPVFKQWLQQQN
jgi:AAA+ ATPase superfamily predicted ATPase